jgi:hypothetical protein
MTISEEIPRFDPEEEVDRENNAKEDEGVEVRIYVSCVSKSQTKH